ncbi:MAG: shikimate kinase [Candidatus Omnitrophica bacterium]|nr:shikimate kinase [Candidatus Omnitrophota bacterium]
MLRKVIILIGFMGAGKSTVAQWLGKNLGWPVVSTDRMIEERANSSIKDIFVKNGEAVFRGLEKAAVEELKDKLEIVIDCGGGVVLDQKNVEVLRTLGCVVYLSTRPDTVLERVRHYSHRPLLNVPDTLKTIQDMLSTREIFYKQAAHKEILTDGKTAEKIGQEILKWYDEYQ